MSNFSINGLLLILSFDLIRTHTGFFKNGIGVWILCFEKKKSPTLEQFTLRNRCVQSM